MAETIKDGGRAFPGQDYNLAGKVNGNYGGMSLRDWLAGQALIGLIGLIGIPEDGPDELWDADTAQRAYAIADAMLAARSKGEK
jgi:hypothetical protein